MRQALEGVHGVRPVTADLLRAREQAVTAVDLLGRDARCAGHRMRRVRVAVEELDRVLRSLHEGVVDGLRRGHGAHRHGAVGQALGHRDHVRHDTEVLRRERCAEPSEAGDDLVEHEQDAVLRADFAQALQVAPGRYEHAGRARHRLHDHGGDGARVVQGDEALELLRKVCAPSGFAARVGVVREVVRVRQVVDARQLRAEELAVVDHAPDGDAAEAHAVITAFAPDEARARAFTSHPVIREGDLERRVDGLRSGVREEHVVESVGEPVHDLVREFEGAGVAHLEGRCVVHLGDLPADRLGDLPAAMPRVHAPQARDAVEYRPTIRGPVMHP